MRIAALAVLVCLIGTGSAAAQTITALQADTMVTSDDRLAKLTYRAGSSTIEVQAERGVDVSALLVAAKIRPTDAPEVIAEKVDRVRERLYPDKEIALSASVPKTAKASQGVSLYRYYVYWNRSSGFYAYFNYMGAAVTFLGRVTGTWDYWECNACSSWRYTKRIGSGGGWTRVFYGGSYTRGFQYRPLVYGSRADIIMYFFY